MFHTAKNRPLRLLVLLTVLQTGCLADPDFVEPAGKCGPRNLTPECCLKHFPGQWERCTGSSELGEVAKHSPWVKATAAGSAGVMAVALNPQINTAERRGVELAADLLAEVESAIEQCTRRADQQVNDYHFNGRSPHRELCQHIKLGEQTTWAAYLGLFKHEQAWPCLREALNRLVPKKHYLLRPRFWLNEKTGKWEYLSENEVSQIVSEQGWKGLTGTIEPDIVIMDVNGFIIHVYDLKFPCPETNTARWEKYNGGRWHDEMQGDIYADAFKVRPWLVSPRLGVQPKR